MDWWWADEFQRLFMAAVRLAHCLGDYLGDWMVRKVSDKERLEEVVENVVFLRGLTGSLNAELPEDDFWYLYEQAERVQELEKELDEALDIGLKMEGEAIEWERKAKRYKQALEYIKREIYTPKNHKWNSEFQREFEKGKIIGLIQASNIVDKAIRKVEGEE